jgi:hypothetical protein
MIRRAFALGALVLACAAPAQVDEPEVFASPTAGFQVAKPIGWHHMSAEQVRENNARVGDAQLRELLKKGTTAPLVAFTKFPEPYDDLNPSFKVSLQPIERLSGGDAMEGIRRLVEQLGGMFPAFEVVQGPERTVVSGIDAAYARFTYDLEVPDGRRLPAMSEMWIVPRSSYFFLIGAGMRQDEKNGSREEIEAIVRSVKIAAP